jgi:hypothetical protein
MKCRLKFEVSILFDEDVTDEEVIKENILLALESIQRKVYIGIDEMEVR